MENQGFKVCRERTRLLITGEGANRLSPVVQEQQRAPWSVQVCEKGLQEGAQQLVRTQPAASRTEMDEMLGQRCSFLSRGRSILSIIAQKDGEVKDRSLAHRFTLC
jgi:hypothetical protein